MSSSPRIPMYSRAFCRYSGTLDASQVIPSRACCCCFCSRRWCRTLLRTLTQEKGQEQSAAASSSRRKRTKEEVAQGHVRQAVLIYKSTSPKSPSQEMEKHSMIRGLAPSLSAGIHHTHDTEGTAKLTLGSRSLAEYFVSASLRRGWPPMPSARWGPA